MNIGVHASFSNCFINWGIMVYNGVLVSAVQQSGSTVVYIYSFLTFADLLLIFLVS